MTLLEKTNMRDTREAMTEPNRNGDLPHQDDPPLQLPPSDGQADEGTTAETNFGEEDTGSNDDQENVGLDVSVGFDQEADLADLLDDAEKEDQRWTEGNETAHDQISLDPRDLEEGDEEGWTEGNDAAGDQVAHHADDPSDEELPPLGPDPDETGTEDAHAGLSNSSRDQGPDDADLPPLDSSSDTEADGSGADDLFDSALLRPLELSAAPEAERIEIAPSVWATRLPAGQVKTEDLGPCPATASVLHVGPQAWLLAEGKVSNLDTSETRTLATAASQWTADPAGAGWILSHDRGLSWHAASGGEADLGGPSADPAMFGHASAAYTHERHPPKLWAETRLGALFVRLEEPTRWSLMDTPRPGRHLSSDGRRSIAYVHAPADRPCVLMQSLDSGMTWLPRRLELDESLIRRVLVCRDVAVVLSDSMTTPILAYVGDAEPTQPVEGLRGPLGLIYEDGEVVLYGCVHVDGRTLLVRQAVGRPAPTVFVVRDLGTQARATSVSIRHDGTHTQLLLVIDNRVERTTVAIEPE